MIPSTTAVIRLDLVDRDPGQPRKSFPEEALRKLADAIKLCGGVFHPIYVRPNLEVPGRYILVAGERRYRALRDYLHVEEYEFRIKEGGLPPYIISMIENSHRESLNAMEEAESYQTAMEREGIPINLVAEYNGKDIPSIKTALRLLTLSPQVQQLIREGKLTEKKRMHTLTQFRNISEQLRLAHLLLRGENPPELIEAETRTSARGDLISIGHLPRDSEGLIRRLLKFRQGVHSAKHVVHAFLGLSQEQQLQGWGSFTAGTRENFTTELREFLPELQRLITLMDVLPPTKRANVGVPKTPLLPAPPVTTAKPAPPPRRLAPPARPSGGQPPAAKPQPAASFTKSERVVGEMMPATTGGECCHDRAGADERTRSLTI